MSTFRNWSGLLWLGCVIGATLVGFYVGASGTQQKCAEQIAGEKNLATAVFVKALIQFRDGRTNEAYGTLETAVDMNVSEIVEMLTVSEKKPNILSVVREYRKRNPQYSETLLKDGNSTSRERHNKAKRSLGMD